MKIVCTLSKRLDYLGRAEVLMRLTVDHTRQYRLRSGILVDAAAWPCDNRRLAALRGLLLRACGEARRSDISAEWLRGLVARHHRPLASWVADFTATRELSVSRRRQYATLARALERFDRHTHTVHTPEGLTEASVADFVTFLREEHRHNPACRPRGHNTVCSMLGRLRALVGWLADAGVCSMPRASAFRLRTGEVYGTPYFLTDSEVAAIAGARIDCPRLAAQRDIFVFQCLTGCRVSDLQRLRPSNVNGGTLEYVAVKTHRERPAMVRVPLHPAAAGIAARYACGERLLPCTSAARYNAAIRSVLTACGITRSVAVLDPLTLLERHRPINEVASSHLARRTFIGNLYSRARDPCIVGAMSGHKDGSAAFARYRTIDDTMKRELIAQTFCRQQPPDTH